MQERCGLDPGLLANRKKGPRWEPATLWHGDALYWTQKFVECDLPVVFITSGCLVETTRHSNSVIVKIFGKNANLFRW